MYWSYASAFGVVPTKYILDTDHNWAQWLSNPRVAEKAGSCLRGAQFMPDAQAPTQLNVMQMWGALFDVDEGAVPEMEAVAALLPWRTVLWTTYNHRPEAPRYALYVPFAVGVPVHHYRGVWERLQGLLGGLAAPGQHNLDRLRYLPRLPSEAARDHYRWLVTGAESARLDPSVEWPEIGQEADAIPIELSDYRSLGDETLSEPDDSDWLDDAAALQKAKVYFGNVGPGIGPGSRHHELFKIGCKLWWDFWLEYDAVVEVLHEVNQRFDEPKPLYEVHREADQTFARTRGRCRVQQPNAAGHMRRRPMGISFGELKQLAQIEKRSSDLLRREVGEILLRIIPRDNGTVDPIANTEYRDKATRLAARHLGQRFPDHDAETLSGLFADSLAVSEAQQPGAPTLQSVQQLIESAQTQVREAREQRRAEEQRALAVRIERACGNGRRLTYSEEEIQQFADNAGCTLEQWQNRWVIVLGSSHYLFVNGDYKAPVSKDNFLSAAWVDLSPIPDVMLMKVNKQGEPTPLDRGEIIARYGTICRRGVANLTAQRSYYDAIEDTFHEAPCPLRTDIVPERVAVVEEWLSLFPMATLVNDWIAWLTVLDRPASSLYLQGQKQSGKTLFAYALARLWSRTAGPTKMSAYFETFNDDLLRCPLLFADEHLPQQLLGPRGSDIYREMVQNQSRPLKRKYLSNTTLHGHMRFLLAANNDRMLPTKGELMTEADSAAVAERLLHIPLDGKPAAFLARLTKAERQAFIDDDLMAKHALWLRDHRRDTNERFVVSGGASRVTYRMDYDGVKGELLRFIYNAITGDGLAPRDDMLPLFVEQDGTIHIAANTQILSRYWEHIFGERSRCPPTGALSEALRVCRSHGDSKRIRFKDQQRRFQLIHSRHVVAWADHNDHDPDRFIEALQKYAREYPDVCFNLEPPALALVSA